MEATDNTRTRRRTDNTETEEEQTIQNQKKNRQYQNQKKNRQYTTRRRTDNTEPEEEKPKVQTTMYRTLYRNLKIEQHEPTDRGTQIVPGNSDGPER
jgi:hypothetical protein